MAEKESRFERLITGLGGTIIVSGVYASIFDYNIQHYNQRAADTGFGFVTGICIGMTIWRTFFTPLDK